MCCNDNLVILFDYLRREEITKVTLDHPITCLNFSADGHDILINLSCDEIWAMDGETLALRHKYQGHKQVRFVIKSCFGGATEGFVVSGGEGMSHPFAYTSSHANLVIRRRHTQHLAPLQFTTNRATAHPRLQVHQRRRLEPRKQEHVRLCGRRQQSPHLEPRLHPPLAHAPTTLSHHGRPTTKPSPKRRADFLQHVGRLGCGRLLESQRIHEIKRAEVGRRWRWHARWCGHGRYGLGQLSGVTRSGLRKQWR